MPFHTPLETVWLRWFWIIYALIKKVISTFLFARGYFIKEIKKVVYQNIEIQKVTGTRLT